MVRQLSDLFLSISDSRQQKKIKYSIRDCLMSGLGMMFLQDPSLLQFQKRMQDDLESNNLNTLFGVSQIPADTQMRKVIDAISPEKISKIFEQFFKLLHRGKQLKNFLFIEDYYLLAIDGSEYFNSEKISCPGCLTKKPKKGKVRCSHQILQPALLHPNVRQVIPLALEPIENTDGTEKQDCEINAARIAAKNETSLPNGRSGLQRSFLG